MSPWLCWALLVPPAASAALTLPWKQLSQNWNVWCHHRKTHTTWQGVSRKQANLGTSNWQSLWRAAQRTKDGGINFTISTIYMWCNWNPKREAWTPCFTFSPSRLSEIINWVIHRTVSKMTSLWKENTERTSPLSPMSTGAQMLHFPPWQSWSFTSQLGRSCAWGPGRVLEGWDLSLAFFSCLCSVLMRFTTPHMAPGLPTGKPFRLQVLGGTPDCIARHWNTHFVSAWRDYALLEPEEGVFLNKLDD